MVNLSDFVQIYDNTLDENKCNFLIDLIEQNPECVQNEDEDYYSVMNLTELRDSSMEVNEIHNSLIKIVFDHRDKYYELFDKRVFPEKHAFEQFKIERYVPNEEEHFFTHIGVKDYSSARRFLCFMWYLNDNAAGQNKFLDLFIQPERGKLVVYPPFWMFPYKKFEPVQEPQYILKTYLHYK